jgi:hypothetical protein
VLIVSLFSRVAQIQLSPKCDISKLEKFNKHTGWKHIKVDQNRQIKVFFESPFLMYLKLA